MTKQPSYRFVGFEDEWKEVKLGEVYSFSQGQQVPVEEQFEQINENRIRFIRIVDLTNKGEEMRYIEFKSSTGRVYEKDIFFVRYGAVGVVGIGYDGIIANNLFKLNPQMSVDNKFMYVQFNREKFKKTLQGFSASTTMPAISFTDIRTIDIYLPSLPEQTAIGSFFQDIDQLISLQQRKLEVLKEQKKTYLKLLFPAKGQTKPALHFAGFEDDWKEVKLGEVAELKRGLTYKPTSVVENGIRVLRSSNIDGDVFKKQEDDVFVEDSSVTIPYVQFGDILITAANGSSKLVGKHAIIEDSEKMVHGGFMLLARSKQYKFLNALLSSEWYSRFINVSVAGGNGAIGNLSKSNLEKEIVLCPTIPEQEAIGSFFQDLDKAIAKQEEKVNQLKESKQTLLRKMFI